MKNLKKVLSLVLALAMAFSLMSVAFAVDKASDFTDYDDVDYQTAVDVMTAIGVFNGYDDGTSFNPTGTLTREQGAKIITYMLLGQESADKLETTSAPFSDVPASKWSAGSIAYCAERGILAGTGDGTFKPEGTLTGQAFAKMLLIALGYDASIQGYTGSAWGINVTADAVDAGIDISGVALSANVTREQAAQMAYQTLTADMVEYDSKGTNITLSDGTSVNIGASKASVIEYRSYSTNGGNNDYTVENTGDSKEGTQQFVEKYFSKLKLSTSTTSSLGVPGQTWKLDNTSVTTVKDTPVAVFTGKMTAAEVASALSGYTITGTDGQNHNITNGTDSNYQADLNLYAIGGDARFDIIRTNSTPAAQVAAKTANGLRVEFYANSNNEITGINITEYYVGEVTNIVTSTDKTTYTIKALNDGSSYTRTVFASENETDTISIDSSIAKGDIVTFTFAKTSADTVVATTKAANKTTAKIFAYPTTKVVGSQSVQNANANTITVNGTVYPVATGVYKDSSDTAILAADFAVSASEATYYLDQFGNVVHSTSNASTDYAFVVQAYGRKSNGLGGYTPAITVKAVLSDGTVVTREVNLEKNSSDGFYYLKGYTNNASYQVTNVATTVATDTDVTGFAGRMVNSIYTYTLTDSTITLDPVTAAPSTGRAVSKTYSTNIGVLSQNTNYYAKTNTGATGYVDTLVDASTTFIAYNADKSTAAVYTGSANLPASVTKENSNTGTNGYAVLKTSTDSANIGTASVVFLNTAAGLSASGSSYAYVVTSDVTVTLASDGSKVYNYTAYKAGDVSGSASLTLTSSTQLNTVSNPNGLYSYTDNNEIGSKLADNTVIGTVQSTLYFYGKLKVQGSQLLVLDASGNLMSAFNITSDTKATFLNGLTEVDGTHYGFVAVVEKSGALGSDVSGYYVTNS